MPNLQKPQISLRDMNITFINATDIYNGSANNSRFFSPNDLVVGVHYPDLGPKCAGSLHQFLTCDTIPVQVMLYWIQLLASSNVSVIIQLYADDKFADLDQHLKHGLVDVLPIEILAYESGMGMRGRRFHETIGGRSTEYYLYNTYLGEPTTGSESPIEFLLAPFTASVWILVTISVLVAFFVEFFLGHTRNSSFYSRMFLSVAALGLCFFSVLYSSHLKALLTAQGSRVPFRDLYDLARMVERGEKHLVVEDNETMRWYLLEATKGGPEGEPFRLPPFQALHRAIRYRGVGKGLIHEPNSSRLCRMLRESDSYVLFADEEVLMTHCGRLCIWKYRVREHPDTPLALPITISKPDLIERADILAHAVNNYRERLYSRRYTDRCTLYGKKESDYIGPRSLIGAMVLLTMGYAASTIAFTFERLYRLKSNFFCSREI